jgi:hypothetical protein
MGRSILKVIGLQRSGTNYLNGLVKRNFLNFQLVPHRVLWKHDFAENVPPEFPDDALVVLIHKSPYSWVESLSRNAKDLWKYHDLKGDGVQVLIRRGNYEGMRVPADLERLCDIYSRYHLGWVRSGHNVMPLAFERLLTDVDGVVAELAAAGLQRRQGDHLDLEFEVNQSRSLSDEDRARLVDATSFDLDDEVLMAITRFVDADLWASLGRTPLPV